MPSYWTKRRKIRHEVEQHEQSLQFVANDSRSTDIVEFSSAQLLVPVLDKTALTDGAETDNCNENLCSSVDCNVTENDSFCFKNDVGNDNVDEVAESCSHASFESRNNAAASVLFETLFDITRQPCSDDELFSEETVASTLQASSEKNTKDLQNKLVNWKVKNPSVSHSALSDILCILQPYFPTLPKDSRTLLKTPSTVTTVHNIQGISGGLYYHFGIKNGIKECLEKSIDFLATPIGNIALQCSCDGLPLFKSSNDQFWPILGMITKPFRSTPFIIGLFYGKQKPTNLDFINEFVQEYIYLQETDSFCYKNTTIYVSINAFVCDAPARAMLKNIKQHSGYFGCERCTQKGVWRGKMTFPQLNASLRTDAAFNQMSSKSHHHGFTPLIETRINLVSDMVLDYMHLVCLGVVRRILMLWIRVH